MAYDTSKLSKLQHLKSLAQKLIANDAALGTRITALENVGAQANVIEGVKVNGALLTLADKIADILIAEGATNGTIKVNNVDVAVHGLAALAYKGEVAYADLATALKNLIDSKAAQSSLDTLTGSGEGSIAKMIDDAFDDFATKVSDDGVINSYKELIDWAAEHGGDAAEMASSISENATEIANLKTLVGQIPAGSTATDIVGYIAEAISALSIGDYMTTAQFTTAIANYYNKSEVDTELGKKVDKETGKSLLSDTEIARLAQMSNQANKTTVPNTWDGTILVDGVAKTVVGIATDTEVNEMLAELFPAED